MRTDRLTSGSMGSFLCPPKHPSHSFSVEFDLNRRKENRGISNIEYALQLDYVSLKTKEAIRVLLNTWEKEKLSLKSEEVQGWIKDCKKHFGGRYIKYIQKYYPDFKGLEI